MTGIKVMGDGVGETVQREVLMVDSKQSGLLPTSVICSQGSVVEVASGAIVSRTLLRSQGGNVTAFAFDEGQALTEHSAPFDAMVSLLEGGLVVTIGGTEHAVSPGNIIVMPANVPHAVRATAPSKWMLVMLKGE